MDAPARIGDRVGRLIGASPGTVVMGDTLSIKVYQALAAALDLRSARRVVPPTPATSLPISTWPRASCTPRPRPRAASGSAGSCRRGPGRECRGADADRGGLPHRAPSRHGGSDAGRARGARSRYGTSRIPRARSPSTSKRRGRLRGRQQLQVPERWARRACLHLRRLPGTSSGCGPPSPGGSATKTPSPSTSTTAPPPASPACGSARRPYSASPPSTPPRRLGRGVDRRREGAIGGALRALHRGSRAALPGVRAGEPRSAPSGARRYLALRGRLSLHAGAHRPGRHRRLSPPGRDALRIAPLYLDAGDIVRAAGVIEDVLAERSWTGRAIARRRRRPDEASRLRVAFFSRSSCRPRPRGGQGLARPIGATQLFRQRPPIPVVRRR